MALFTVGKKKQDDRAQIPPSALKIAFKEIFRSKAATVAFCTIVVILLITFGGSLFLNSDKVIGILRRLGTKRPLAGN